MLYQPYNQNPYGGRQNGQYMNPYGAPCGAPAVQMQPPMIPGRAVQSREEADAQQVDFQGTPLIMPDWGHGRIYIKQFNQMTGDAPLTEIPIPGYQKTEGAAPAYATQEDVQKIWGKLNELTELLK